MATIRERISSDKISSYHVQIRLRGQPPVTATFDSKTMARQWAEKIQTEIREGRYFKTAEAKKHTFAEAVQRYERDILPKLTPYEAKQRKCQLGWWQRQLGDYLLADLSPARIVEQRDMLASEISKTGRKRSNATVCRYLAVLSHLFTTCVKEWGWMEDNPVSKVTKPSLPSGIVRFLSKDERKNLLKACKNSKHPMLYPVVVVAISTGARKSEIMNIHWRNINFATNGIVLEKTKNGERRTVPLTGLAHTLLENLSKVRRIDTDLVFAREDGQAPVELKKHWKAAVAEAELQNFRFHDLRHTAASYLLESGATLAELAGILGHKTLQMVKRYAHLSEQHGVAVAERMTSRIFGEVE